MSESFSEPKSLGGRVKVELYMCNCVKKPYIMQRLKMLKLK